MSEPKRQMKLAAFFNGPSSATTGWRMPRATPQLDMSFALHVKAVQAAERGKFDTVFFQDTAASMGSEAMAKGDRSGSHHRVTRLEPMSILPALATMTKNIGLIATGTTTYNEPFHIARKFLTIDHISNGRAGWNLVTTQGEEEAQNFGRDHHMDHAQRYDRAMEFYDVVTGLWDSWEEDAVVRNKETGQYFDPDKVHLLNHVGKHFKVRGPLNVARSPQGRPIVAQAGSSEAGKEMAAKGADIVFTAQTTLEDAQEFYGDLKGRMAKYGRSQDHLKVLPGINVLVARTESDAKALHTEMESYVTLEAAMRTITRLTGDVNLWDYDLDGPLPELPPSNAALGRQKLLVDTARRENLSIRQLAYRFTEANGHNVLVGTPAYVADAMEHWFREYGADGYTVMSPYFSHPLEDFVDLVVPEIQKRGLFRTEYEGTTLRDSLGIPVPQNRYTGTRYAMAGQ